MPLIHPFVAHAAPLTGTGDDLVGDAEVTVPQCFPRAGEGGVGCVGHSWSLPCESACRLSRRLPCFRSRLAIQPNTIVTVSNKRMYLLLYVCQPGREDLCQSSPRPNCQPCVSVTGRRCAARSSRRRCASSRTQGPRECRSRRSARNSGSPGQPCTATSPAATSCSPSWSSTLTTTWQTR